MQQAHFPTHHFSGTARDWLVFAATLHERDELLSQNSTSFGKARSTSMSSQVATTPHVSQMKFARFLEQRQNQILRTALQILRSRDDALDVLQEVALKLFKHWERLEEERNVDGYVYRMTVNECLKWLRSHRNHPVVQDDTAADSIPSSSPSQEAMVRTRQFQEFLAGALDILSEQERLAYILRDLEQRPGKEIASVLGCQGATARGYYFSARKKLASHIRQQAPEWLSLLGKGGV